MEHNYEYNRIIVPVLIRAQKYSIGAVSTTGIGAYNHDSCSNYNFSFVNLADFFFFFKYRSPTYVATPQQYPVPAGAPGFYPGTSPSEYGNYGKSKPLLNIWLWFCIKQYILKV